MGKLTLALVCIEGRREPSSYYLRWRTASNAENPKARKSREEGSGTGLTENYGIVTATVLGGIPVAVVMMGVRPTLAPVTCAARASTAAISGPEWR